MIIRRRTDDEAVESVDLADEAATAVLAKWLAGFACAGDFISLSGDLGVGKTALARAFLKTLTGDPDLEAPSPTYTLIQVYEGPDFRAVHADFHRLRGAEELTQLGWDEAIEGAVALVEWPERVVAALPADRMEIALWFDPGRGGEFRRAEITTRGAMAARFKRARAIETLLERAGWAQARRAPLHGDASARAFERLNARDGQAAVLMISPPLPSGPTIRFGKSYAEIAKLSADIRAFIAMAEGLRALGLSAPRIYAHSLADGLALIEDFGDETIADELGPNASRYAEAASLIADLHRRALPTELPIDGESYLVPTYDIEAMLIEVELALDWYAPAIARGIPSSGARMQFLALWREALTPVLAEPTTWTLRDFHSPNLLWLADREGKKRLGLIDFQDAVLGPPAYDLASLLQDARVEVPDHLELRLLAQYTRERSAADWSFDRSAFTAAYSIMGAQRATKILGIFARLDRRDGKPQYLEHLPRIERTLTKNLMHPMLEPLRRWFEAHLPRALGPIAGLGESS